MCLDNITVPYAYDTTDPAEYIVNKVITRQERDSCIRDRGSCCAVAAELGNPCL